MLVMGTRSVLDMSSAAEAPTVTDFRQFVSVAFVSYALDAFSRRLHGGGCSSPRLKLEMYCDYHATSTIINLPMLSANSGSCNF